MKVLAINSSSRKDGNTALLVNTVFSELNKEGIETEMVQLAGEIIEPCKACWACGGRKNCVHKKDRFREIFEKMTQANGIILASPVYTANISANMQAFLERASVVTDMNRDAELFRHKVGAAVTAARRGGAVNTIDAMNHFFLLQNMFVVGSSYWPIDAAQNGYMGNKFLALRKSEVAKVAPARAGISGKPFFGNGAAGCGAKADDFGIDPVAGEVLKFSCRCDGASCKCVVLFNGCFYFSGNSILPRK